MSTRPSLRLPDLLTELTSTADIDTITRTCDMLYRHVMSDGTARLVNGQGVKGMCAYIRIRTAAYHMTWTHTHHQSACVSV